MSWHDRAVETIRQATEGLPLDMPLEQRMKIVDAAYPFGERKFTPHKMWLKARRAYLARFGYRVELPLFDLPMSPLERARARAK